MSRVKEVRKALTALVTFAVAGIAYGVIQEPYTSWVLAAIAGLGVYGVYAIPNAPKEPTE